MIWHAVVIEHVKEGRERSDAVATQDELMEMARRAEYDSKGEAHIRSKCGFSFGTSTSIIKVHRVSTRLSFALCKAPLIMYLVPTVHEIF